MTFLKYIFSRRFREDYKESYTAELAGKFSNEERELENIFSGLYNDVE